MAALYPGAIPDLDALYYANPLGSANYLGFMAEVQAALDSLGINPQGASGTAAARFTAIEAKLAQSALLATTADGTGPSNTTTETAFPTGQYTVPGFSAVVGRTYRVTAGGKLSTSANSPTMTFRLRWGATTGSPLLVATAASPALTSFSNVGWYLNLFFTVRTIGASGTAMGTGMGIISGQVPLGDTTSSVVIDTTNDAVLTLFAKWTVGTPSASDTITLENFLVERVN